MSEIIKTTNAPLYELLNCKDVSAILHRMMV